MLRVDHPVLIIPSARRPAGQRQRAGLGLCLCQGGQLCSAPRRAGQRGVPPAGEGNTRPDHRRRRVWPRPNYKPDLVRAGWRCPGWQHACGLRLTKRRPAPDWPEPARACRLDSWSCDGTERRLDECSHGAWKKAATCTHNEDISIQCGAAPSEPWGRAAVRACVAVPAARRLWREGMPAEQALHRMHGIHKACPLHLQWRCGSLTEATTRPPAAWRFGSLVSRATRGARCAGWSLGLMDSAQLAGHGAQQRLGSSLGGSTWPDRPTVRASLQPQAAHLNPFPAGVQRAVHRPRRRRGVQPARLPPPGHRGAVWHIRHRLWPHLVRIGQRWAQG